jgi:hypothetical protein
LKRIPGHWLYVVAHCLLEPLHFVILPAQLTGYWWFQNLVDMNGLFLMCNPPGVDLAVENRKLGGQFSVDVKQGCHCVRLLETRNKVLGDRVFEFCPVTSVNVLGINHCKLHVVITAAIVAATIRVAIEVYVAVVIFFTA